MSEIIKVESLARVEGHGGITIVLQDGRVKDVKVEIYEGPRLIETLVKGKTIEEDVSITSRICAICTLSHRYAAIKGIEKALDIKVPRKTHLMRTLMHIGEMIESHALHVYLLALPDLLGYPSAIAMADKYETEVTEGLLIKKLGTNIMKTVSARKIHGENPRIGGFGRFPDNRTFRRFKIEALRYIDAVEKVVKILGEMEYDEYFNEDCIFMCLEPPNNEFGYVGDTIIVSDGSKFDVEQYNSVFTERVVSHSFAKRALYKGKPFFVGALARVNLLGDRLTGLAKKYYDKYKNKNWFRNPLYNNLAQAIELLYCLETIPKLVDELVKLENPELVVPTKESGIGTGAVEAPRGTLYHHYEIKDLHVAKCDIVTPTAQNLDNIEYHIKTATKKLLAENKRDRMPLYLEMIARAYDPCISCATHLVKVVEE